MRLTSGSPCRLGILNQDNDPSLNSTDKSASAGDQRMFILAGKRRSTWQPLHVREEPM
jgi:hypothetical protein